jgi:hypothetical protein
LKPPSIAVTFGSQGKEFHQSPRNPCRHHCKLAIDSKPVNRGWAPRQQQALLGHDMLTSGFAE